MPPRSPPPRACIIDECGPYYIDSDYVKLGTREGWLTRDSYFVNEFRQIVWIYVLSRSPP